VIADEVVSGVDPEVDEEGSGRGTLDPPTLFWVG
jgi:hypothetical protein